MPSLFGQWYTREQLMRRVGHISQVGGVQVLSNEDGPARGVRLLEFRTGMGLVLKVGIERGLDVGYCEYRGHSLAWIPPTKLPGPWYFEQPDGFGWLRSALGGFNNTCGMLRPGLGLELNEAEIAAHPYVRNPFPSLWDEGWLTHFKQS